MPIMKLMVSLHQVKGQVLSCPGVSLPILISTVWRVSLGKPEVEYRS